MDKVALWEKVETIEDGVFVKKNSVKFIITDNFLIKSVSVLHYYDILKEFGVEDLFLIEERTLKFGRKELLDLLKKFVEGNGVLTKICFPDLCIRRSTALYNDEIEMKIFESKYNTPLETWKLHIKLIINRINNNVVCAELGEDFVDQLFSFLTFPLGLVLKLIGSSKSLGCVTNLYNSIQELKINCFKSEKEKKMLISPQLAPFFGHNKQMLNINIEIPELGIPRNGCRKCYWDDKKVPCNTMCEHGVLQSYSKESDPKLAKSDKDLNGGFVRRPQIFLVTDDLHVTPTSLLSFKQILTSQGLHVDHLEKKEITIGRAQVRFIHDNA
ncbi:hypothetical protein MA16_Dca002247 [Dendrobium catenatum]|uniref:DUF674 domain-containing protein n=1 Tax=Dendrobium catenatum TaxID=906689 RepID=A0A2I0W007_9ASPA|nr:hypothetical protein MA16_Dca002247 [Dendrobium catenatum]